MISYEELLRRLANDSLPLDGAVQSSVVIPMDYAKRLAKEEIYYRQQYNRLRDAFASQTEHITNLTNEITKMRQELAQAMVEIRQKAGKSDPSEFGSLDLTSSD